MTKERWTDTDGTALDYWLYTPENPAEDMPLIVYLHGGSGKGNDLEKILDEGSLPGYLWSGQLSPAAYCPRTERAGQTGRGIDEADLPCGSRLRH